MALVKIPPLKRSIWFYNSCIYMAKNKSRQFKCHLKHARPLKMEIFPNHFMKTALF